MIKYLLIPFILIINIVIAQPDSTSDNPSHYADSLNIENRKDTIEAEQQTGFPDSVRLSAQEVLDKYISAIGGKAKIYNIVDRTTVIRGSVQGVNITIVSYQKAPNKLKQVIRAGSNEQIIIFDGERGIMKMAGEEKEITGSELEKLKYESTLALLTDIEHYGIKLEVEGIEKINDKTAYKILMTLPSGIKWTQYYDTESGLKLKEEKYINVPTGLMQQEISYGNYKEVGGILYPYKIMQSIGTQSMDFTVSSIKVNTGLVDREFEIQ